MQLSSRAWLALSAVLGGMIVVVGGIAWFAFYSVTPITKIGLQGKEGLEFIGTIKADGRVLRVNGVLPAEYIVAGRKVDCRFEKKDEEGRLALRLYSGEDGAFQETYTDQKRGVVEGTVKVRQGNLGTAKYSKRESTLKSFRN